MSIAPDMERRDPDVIGETSRAGIERRSPKPVPMPAVASGPQPTQAPSKRHFQEPDHLRVRADDFAQHMAQRADDRDAQIIGPFYARDTLDVERIKRDVIDRRRRGDLASLVKRSHEDLMPRDSVTEEEVRSWELARRDFYAGQELERRQTEAQETCFVGNEDLSCYPTEGTNIVQGRWSRFIWNSNYPLFAQRGYVDVYLFQQDTDDLVTSWTSQDNGAGRLSFRPQDSWWQGRILADNIQPGQNISWPFYFVVLASGSSLTGTTSRLATWTAIQTALPVAVASSRSAAAAASLSSASSSPTLTGSAAVSALQSSLSEALESSLRASGLSGTETLAGTATETLPNGSVITATATAAANGGAIGGNGGNSNGLALPTYAIVLIAVLGFLALVAAIAGAYFIMAALRRKRQRQAQRGSYGSGSPMMAAAAGSLAGASTTESGQANETTQMLDADGHSAFPASAAAAGAAGVGAGAGSRSIHSNDSHPFTSDEATRMADAFRNALRKPEFSPSGLGESSGGDGESPTEDTPERASDLLRSELAAEGKDLRSVGDRKKPTWHDE